MQDTKLDETILGLTAPWHVARVALDAEAERIDIWPAHGPTRWPCPTCGEPLPGFDHAAARTWRHLDTCQFTTHVHAEIPRVQCPTHGVKQVRVPWAEPRNRFTLLMKMCGPCQPLTAVSDDRGFLPLTDAETRWLAFAPR